MLFRAPVGRPGETAAPLFLHFDHTEIGDAPLGGMIENRHMRVALRKALANSDGVTLMAPDRIVSFDVAPSHVSVILGSGTLLEGALLVGADGRRSQIRQQSDIQTVGWSYGQSGIVTTVEHALPHDGVAQEYFLPSGPFAVLPMVGNRSSLVWTEETELADALLGLDDEGVAAACAKRFVRYLGESKLVRSRVC
mgnify:FL=1